MDTSCGVAQRVAESSRKRKKEMKNEKKNCSPRLQRAPNDFPIEDFARRKRGCFCRARVCCAQKFHKHIFFTLRTQFAAHSRIAAPSMCLSFPFSLVFFLLFFTCQLFSSDYVPKSGRPSDTRVRSWRKRERKSPIPAPRISERARCNGTSVLLNPGKITA